MRVVIQCAGSKRSNAGSMLAPDGQTVRFVAHPELAPRTAGVRYVRPDDMAARGTWRELILSYNDAKDNPLELLPAYRLYQNEVYRQLVQHFGSANVFILSAGWGLLAAEFLTPDYDITFSSSAAAHVKRGRKDVYDDFNQLDLNSEEPVHFLGGKNYLALFLELTRSSKARRIAYYNSINEPHLEGCEARRFMTTTRTNWHYECASALIAGELSFPDVA